MNLKSLPPKVRIFVESLEDAVDEAGYQIVDVDEDGDTVAITFRRDVGSAEAVDHDEEEEH